MQHSRKDFYHADCTSWKATSKSISQALKAPCEDSWLCLVMGACKQTTGPQPRAAGYAEYFNRWDWGLGCSTALLSSTESQHKGEKLQCSQWARLQSCLKLPEGLVTLCQSHNTVTVQWKDQIVDIDIQGQNNLFVDGAISISITEDEKRYWGSIVYAAVRQQWSWSITDQVWSQEEG